MTEHKELTRAIMELTNAVVKLSEKLSEKQDNRPSRYPTNRPIEDILKDYPTIDVNQAPPIDPTLNTAHDYFMSVMNRYRMELSQADAYVVAKTICDKFPFSTTGFSRDF